MGVQVVYETKVTPPAEYHAEFHRRNGLEEKVQSVRENTRKLSPQ
jgi:hypothetical protein